MLAAAEVQRGCRRAQLQPRCWAAAPSAGHLQLSQHQLSERGLGICSCTIPPQAVLTIEGLYSSVVAPSTQLGICAHWTFWLLQINLFLRVVRRREDGYHDLASLFHVSLQVGDGPFHTRCHILSCAANGLHSTIHTWSSHAAHL